MNIPKVQNDTIPEKYTRRFLTKLKEDAETNCWIWQAGKFEDGYGAYYLNGKLMHAHRASYLIFTGQIPDGLYILHECDTPLCVNPDHLYAGTQAQNMQDMVSRNRALTGDSHPLRRHPECRATGKRSGAYTHPEKVRRGEDATGARLAEVTVLEIRQLLAIGSTHGELAVKFGVHRSTISLINCGKTWKHI